MIVISRIIYLITIYSQSEIHWILDCELNVGWINYSGLPFTIRIMGTKMISFASMREMVKNINKDGHMYILIEYNYTEGQPDLHDREHTP